LADMQPANSDKATASGNAVGPARTISYGRLAVVALLLAAVAGTFVYLGGWLTPGDLTPAKFADAFQAVDGTHPGFRRNHAKGVCVTGYFDSNGNGAAISRASVFQSGHITVVGRFSLAGGMPMQVDTPGQVRGLGLQFITSDGQEWRTAMVNLPVFPVSTPQAFYDRMIALVPDPATGKPDPAKMQAFLAANPETVAAIKILKANPPADGFYDTTFHGLNAFIFTSAQSASSPVRWIFEPDRANFDTLEPTSRPSPPAGPNYLFDELVSQLRRGPLRWHLILIVGQPSDPTNDATLPWPDARPRIDAGTLTIDQAQSEDADPQPLAATLNFDPLVLPRGMAPSDDPLLSARSAVYSASFTRRSGEDKAASAVTPADVSRAGGDQ
jgi:catalase